MSHLVLARKYRPKKLADVVGQDAIVATLKSAIEHNRIAHSLLFTGGRGTGKTTVARIMAKALVCTERTDAEPCNVCSQCVAIDNFSSLDVIEIDGASHTGVDDVRDLRESARFQPTSAKYKIFIIDEVHMLSVSAFNALLKILEEPPAHVMFIFATTEVHKIPKTILSRCQRYDFRRVDSEVIVSTLKLIGEKEKFSIDDEGLRLIAKLADGGMRDALSMTEQIISSGQSKYSSQEISAILGIVSHQAVKDLCAAVINGNVTPALFIAKEIYEKGLDLCQMMDAIAEYFRALSLCAHVDKKSATALNPSLTSEDFLLAEQHDKADLKRLFSMAIDGITEVFKAEKPLLSFELFILRTALRPTMADAVTINYHLQKLDAIMNNRPLPPPAEVKKKDTVELFRDVIASIAQTSPALSSHLRHGRPEINNNNLTLTFEHSLHYEQALETSNLIILKQAVAKIFSLSNIDIKLNKIPLETTIKTVAEADDEKKRLAREKLFSDAKNHPIAKKALEIFGGEIVDIKNI